ncbi:MAG TPA: serpin family protein [Gemmataceae bacterium]|nr:serpin family protein [Gemmataceae bacterium]
MKYCLVVALGIALGGLAVAQPPGKLNPDTATVVKGDNAFAMELYRDLAKKEGNLFLSPYSISTALAMTYAGARGETAQQMAKALHFTLPQERLHPAFADLLKQTTGAVKARKYHLQVANRLWGQKDYGFLPDFLKLTEVSYGAGLQEVDFIGATEQARKTINAWVEKQTKNKIKDLLQPGVLDDYTRLVLTNAIYFKAAWMHPFDPKRTVKGDFHVTADKKVTVPLMRGKHRTNYTNTGTIEALELPYEQYDLSMIVLLPKKGNSLADLEKDLTEANVAAWVRKLSDHEVDITLPKFTVTAEFSLKHALSRLGMPIAFDRQKADFSGIATREKLHISAVVHKAFVDVNELGTEAAAATAVAVGTLSLPQPATFRADRPFAYLIRDNRTGSILFMGRVVNPQ